MPEEEEGKTFRVEPLGPRHDRAAFSCGVGALDNYLRLYARQELKRRITAPYVLTADGKFIAGYYTLSQFAVNLCLLPRTVARELPRYPDIPATLLGRLAIDRGFQRQGLGEFLLMDALRRALDHSKQIASFAVIVDAKDETAAAFYRRYGFLALPNVSHRLFLPMATIERLFS